MNLSELFKNVTDITEGSAESGRPFEGKKKRAPKTLWFDIKELWGHDIKSRYPDAELYQVGEQDRYVAVDVEKKMCYGIWQHNRNKGCTYHNPRPIASTIKSREIRKMKPFGK